MTTQRARRRGNAAQIAAFTGAEAEMSINTTTWTAQVHDGVTAGGHELVGIGASQTLTNKTLANPVFTGTAAMDGLTVDGNVGIGSGTAYSPLSILNGTDISMGAGATGQFNITGNGYGFGIALNATGGHLYTNSASRPLIFGVNETEHMRIDGSGTISPGADNAQDFGKANVRLKDIYAANDTIQTSDAREKTPVRGLTDAEMRVAKKLSQNIGFFKWLASIEAKGDDARTHCGQTVQFVIAEFNAEGLDPFDYGMVCYNQWNDEFLDHPSIEASAAILEVLDEKGEIISHAMDAVEGVDAWIEQVQFAGDRYALRNVQLNSFMLRGLDARIAALEI